MIVGWVSEFDGAAVLLTGVLAILLLVTLVPGLMRMMLLISGESPVRRLGGTHLSVLSMAALAWFLLIFSLCFGPAFDPFAEGGGDEPPMSMADMMQQAASAEGETHLIGRGGWIGNLEFALFRTLAPQGNTDEPLFAARPPSYRIPQAVFQVLQLAVFLAAAGSLLALLSARLPVPAAAAGTLVWAVLAYAPAVHWLWGDGWLSARGGFDFGGGLLFLVLGSSAAALAVVLPRAAGTGDNAGSGPQGGLRGIVAVPLAFAGVAVLILSFRPSAPGVSAVALFNTLLAACTGSVVAGGMAWLRPERPAGNDSLRGLLIGLVVAAGASGVVLPASMMVAAFLASIVACGLYNVMDRSNTGRLSAAAVCCLLVPAVCGLIGVGIFGHENYAVTHWNGEFISGLAEGNAGQLQAQLEVVVCCGLHAFVVTALLALLVRRWALRSEQEAVDV